MNKLFGVNNTDNKEEVRNPPKYKTETRHIVSKYEQHLTIDQLTKIIKMISFRFRFSGCDTYTLQNQRGGGHSLYGRK